MLKVLLIAKVKVFGKEADWTNRDDLDYISQLVVPSTLSKGCEVIICNGHTQDFLFYRFVKQILSSNILCCLSCGSLISALDVLTEQ